ncbi:hypothetical protein R2R35_03140 [Anaerocolumna sp. AGMB13020]|uniref:hypothetical protein n=1 Tax=Anaerocolumna sp. AGMB13020 TaxID=3081750 RepID=UPI002954D648|nr:hypothetical protein [Anaerocolumna sp. AGMB13020]WOO37507.1 hypothetical protein R2R35_03140 [Anaerocolumna sp. AGMB13020]
MAFVKDIRLSLMFSAFLSVGAAVLAHLYLGIINGFQLMYVPFELLGKGLRLLSLASAIGNGVAIAVYLCLALIPFIYWFISRKAGNKPAAGFLLPIISVYSLFLIYFFINPGIMVIRLFPDYGSEVMVISIKAILAFLFWGMWLSYFLLKSADIVLAPASYHKSIPMIRQLQLLLKAGTYLYTIIYSFCRIYPVLTEVSRSAQTEGAAETAGNIKIILLFLLYAINSIPVVLTIWIFVKGIDLLEAMTDRHLKKEEQTAAIALGRVSKIAIYGGVICGLASNLLQLIICGYLKDLTINIYLPLFPLITAFVSMILSGYFKEAGRLKENDELYI